MRTSASMMLALVVAAVEAPSVTGQSDGPGHGQPIEVTDSTQIRSVAFELLGEATVGEDDLRAVVAARGRGGMVGLRRAFGWVPFVADVPERTFDPHELQRDRERLRRYLQRVGYPRSRVDYAVTRDSVEDVVDIRFLVDPGTPVLVETVAVRWSDVAPPPVDTAGAGFRVRESGVRPGVALDSRALRRAARAVELWLGDRGYAFARAGPELAVDSAAMTARVLVRAEAGPRARIRRIELEGNHRLSDRLLRRFSRVEEGQWYSGRRLAAAGRRLSALDAVDWAGFEVPPGQPPDTLVDLRLRVEEAMRRTVSVEAGYATEGGLGGQAEWTHRDVFHGAQSVSVALAGESGVLALPDNSNRYIRGTLTLRQPIPSRRQITVLLGPFAEYRDDYRDRSLELGGEVTLLHQLGTLSSVALRYQLATRRIYQYHLGGTSGGVDLLELLELGAKGVLDRFGTRLNTSTLTLSASLGSLDLPIEPRRGFVVQPSLTITAPAALTTNEYVLANLRLSGYVPVGRRVTLAARAGGAKLWPRGASVPATQEDGLTAAFRLRDVLLTAGGARDVRGWADGLLGPKFPRVVLVERNGAVVAEADRFVPIGGFNRLHATLELRGPLPPLGDHWASHAFVDAGRIWTRDERFTDSSDPLGVEKLFWSVGAGVDYATPLGSVRVTLAYKMNPSILDLADPQELTDAILAGTPLDALPRHPGRRFHLHLGLGRRL